jgi:hypothetical protein
MAYAKQGPSVSQRLATQATAANPAEACQALLALQNQSVDAAQTGHQVIACVML